MLKYLKKEIFKKRFTWNFFGASKKTKEPIKPGELLRHKIDYNHFCPINDPHPTIVFHEHIMFIETKARSYFEFEHAFEHFFLNASGKITSIIDGNEAFFIEDYTWLEKIE